MSKKPHVSIEEAFASVPEPAPFVPTKDEVVTVENGPADFSDVIEPKGHKDLSLVFKACGQSFKGDEGLTEVVKDITFSVEGDQTIAILGPSGCGKSTILRMVSGMHPRGTRMPTVGECLINGEAVTSPHDDVLTVFQTPVLAPWLSVLGNVMLSFKPFLFGPRARKPWEVAQDLAAAFGDRFEATRMKIPCSAPMKDIEKRAIAMLEDVGLADSLHKFPHQLSGGMRQRASLATSLVVEPPILCMDEPFSALDPTTNMEMRELVKKLKKKYPCMVLFVTHNVGEALDLADRVIVLSTRPATIVGDITLPEEKPADWRSSPEYASTEAQILHLIRDAAGATGGGGKLTLTV